MARSTILQRAYDNSASGLVATTIPGAIDEVEARVDIAEADIDALELTDHAAVTLAATDPTTETISLAGQEITLNLATPTTDGIFAATDKTKLDGVETGATADQTGAEIKAAYEGEANTNAFTDAEQIKLAGIEALAKDDQDANEVTVIFSPTTYMVGDDDVEAHLIGIHTKIGQLDTQLAGGVNYQGGYNAAADFPSLDGQQTTLSGTAALDDTINVVGTGTFFTTEIAVGDSIIIAGETREVATIADDTNLTVTAAFTAGTVSGQTIEKIGVVISGILTGYMYTVTDAGDFFTEAKVAGDVLIAEADDPTLLTHWTRVESNIENATDVAYINTTSALVATNVQAAIDEVEARVDTLEAAPAGNPFVDVDDDSANGAPSAGLDGTSIGGGTSTGVGGVAIGPGASSGAAAVAIGEGFVDASGDRAIAIGAFGTGATSNDAIAIGSAILNEFQDSIAIGPGAGTGADNVTVVGHDANAAGLSAVALGHNADASGDTSVAIGEGANASETDSIAIGDGAVASGLNAVQIGAGTNASASTLNYLGAALANQDGLLTSFETPSNYTPVDSDNVTSHLEAIDTALANTGLAQPLTVNAETITANKTLLVDEDVYQHLLCNTAALGVSFPGAPVNGTHYIIKSNASSTQSFTVDSAGLNVVVAAGEILEVIYDGAVWVIL